MENNNNNIIGNIERAYQTIGKKLPIAKVKLGLTIALTAIMGLTVAWNDIAYAYHAIQQRNIRMEMADLHEEAESSRIYIQSLQAEYKSLEDRLDYKSSEAEKR